MVQPATMHTHEKPTTHNDVSTSVSRSLPTKSTSHLRGLTAKLQIDPHMQPAARVGTLKSLQLPKQASSIRGVSNGCHRLLALVQQSGDDNKCQLLHARSEPNSSVSGLVSQYSSRQSQGAPNGLQRGAAACIELTLAACLHCRLAGLISLPAVCSCRGLQPWTTPADNFLT